MFSPSRNEDHLATPFDSRKNQSQVVSDNSPVSTSEVSEAESR